MPVKKLPLTAFPQPGKISWPVRLKAFGYKNECIIMDRFMPIKLSETLGCNAIIYTSYNRS